MIRPIVHDPIFLAGKSEPATEADLQVIIDLTDTLRDNLDHCVGMAANMIGERKRIIVFCNGPILMTMVNPRITEKSREYEAEEGCLSLAGVRKTKRFRKITVKSTTKGTKQRTIKSAKERSKASPRRSSSMRWTIAMAY